MLDNKDIKKYFSNMEKRVVSFQSQVMGDIATQFKDAVKANAQGQGETYQDDLSVSRVKGADSVFIVHVSAQSQSLSETVNPAIFYYIPINPYSVDSDLTAVLVDSQPYTKDFIPYNPNGYYKLIYRKVSPEEWQVVQDKNASSVVSLFDRMMAAGANPSLVLEPSSSPDDLPVVEDVVWRVIRQELGIRERRKMVWTPAIQDFFRKKNLKQAVKNPELDRILIDGNWQKVFQVDSEVDDSYVKKFEKFQQYILGV